MSRPPKSAELHNLHGSTSQVGRSAKSAQPSVHVGGRPTMPKYFGEVAAAKWRSLVGLLVKRGTLAKLDGSLLEIHCQLYERWRAALDEVNQHGAYETSAEGNRVETGASKAVVKLAAQLRQNLIQLGATPVTRDKTKPAAVDPATQPSYHDMLAAEKAEREARAKEPAPEPEPDEQIDFDELERNMEAMDA